MQVIKFETGPIQVNTYLAFDSISKKGFIVDPGGYSAELSEKVKENGLTIEYIILTHGHGDHIGGVMQYKEEYPNAKLLAYKDEKELLNNAAQNVSADLFGFEIELEADVYVSDRDSLDIGNMKLHFIYTPGHTKGGMCILVDDYLFSGDTLFCQSIGRTDFYGGSFNEIIKSIKERLFVLPDNTHVLPGHMGETQIGFEKRSNPFV